MPPDQNIAESRKYLIEESVAHWEAFTCFNNALQGESIIPRELAFISATWVCCNDRSGLPGSTAMKKCLSNFTEFPRGGRGATASALRKMMLAVKALEW